MLGVAEGAINLYAHGMLLVWCVCDWCGEFNAPLCAHEAARSLSMAWAD